MNQVTELAHQINFSFIYGIIRFSCNIIIFESPAEILWKSCEIEWGIWGPGLVKYQVSLNIIEGGGANWAMRRQK